MYTILTPFPELLNYAFFVPTLLRLVLGIYVLAFVFTKEKDETKASPLQSVIRFVLSITSICILAGFGIQISALVTAILLLIAAFKPNWTLTKNEIVLLILISLSLVVLGAGAYAFDLPL